MGYKSKLKQMRRKGQGISQTFNDKAWEKLLALDAARKAEEEACWSSMKRECDAIVKNKYDLQSSYQAARVLLYKTLLEEKENLKDWENTSNEGDKNIRKAGEMLYSSGGMRDMHDPLLWSFIPKPAYRYIDHIWDGIGDWRA